MLVESYFFSPFPCNHSPFLHSLLCPFYPFFARFQHQSSFNLTPSFRNFLRLNLPLLVSLLSLYSSFINLISIVFIYKISIRLCNPLFLFKTYHVKLSTLTYHRTYLEALPSRGLLNISVFQLNSTSDFWCLEFLILISIWISFNSAKKMCFLLSRSVKSVFVFIISMQFRNYAV